MTPIVNGLESEFEGQVTIIRLDANESANAALQNKYGVRGHPAFATLNSDGQIVERFFGEQTAVTLREAMNNLQQNL